jgi:hypothetical protein
MLNTLLGKLGYVRAERNRLGEWWYTIEANGLKDEGRYLELSLANPVLMTIIALRANIYSQLEIKHLDTRGEVIENSPVVALLNNPNYFQSREDFFFQQMWFMSASGYNYTYQRKAFRSDALPKSMYNLIPSEIDLNDAHKLDKFIFTEADFKKYGEREIEYKLDTKKIKIPLSELIPFYDLGNGLERNSFMQSPSRVRGIIEPLSNISENLKAKNVNLQMSQKYLGRNTSDGNESQLQPDDKNAIERVISAKNLIVTNRANVEVQHLVSDLKKLYLDEQYANDMLKCLLAFDMNKDVLNPFGVGSSTFENQEKGELRYLQNSIIPTAKSTMNSFAQQWGLYDKGERLIASYDHLNIMQPVVNQKIDTLIKLENAIKLAKENGTMTDAEAVELSKQQRLNLGL